MMNFIFWTLCITVAILLSTFITILIVMSKPVMKLYMNWVQKWTTSFMDGLLIDTEEEETV